MGIALSACGGFRAFIPMLAGAIAGHFNVIALPADMQWLGSWPAIACFGTAAVAEVGAYYIPFIANMLDVIATPLSVAAGYFTGLLHITCYRSGTFDSLGRGINYWWLGSRYYSIRYRTIAFVKQQSHCWSRQRCCGYHRKCCGYIRFIA